MADDGVEGLPCKGGLADIGMAQRDVAEAERGNAPVAVIDVRLGDVDAGDAGVRKLQRERDNVASGRAADLEHARAGRGGAFITLERGNAGQARRVGIGERHGDVGEQVVVAAARRGEGRTCIAFGVRHGPLLLLDPAI